MNWHIQVQNGIRAKSIDKSCIVTLDGRNFSLSQDQKWYIIEKHSDAWSAFMGFITVIVIVKTSRSNMLDNKSYFNQT